jgi:adenylate cyclase, class 2
MQIEYEATFENVDKDEMRARLKKAGADLARPEFLSKRVTMNLPDGHEIPNAWIRVRDNGKKITQTLKIVENGKIENQQELEIEVRSFDDTVKFLEKIGCRKKSYQETKREKWAVNEVEITIDEWPFLEPFVEVEGKSEEEVRRISEKLGFDYSEALFCAIGHLYYRKYNVSEHYFNNEVPKLTFSMENPFMDIK